jgi:hypothetical protein
VAAAVGVLVVSLCGAASWGVARQMNLPIFGSVPMATTRPTMTATTLPSPTPQPSPTLAPLPTATSVPLPVVQAAFVKVDNTTEGSWSGVYGAQGYILATNNDPTHAYSKIPGYAVVIISSASIYDWTDATTDPRALQKPPGAGASDRIAACWYTYPLQTFTIDVGVTDGETHRLALYLLDWDGYGGGRVERIDAVNATTGATLDSRVIGQPNGDTNPNDQFHSGKYLVWQVRGHVRIIVTNLNSNAVLSGIFFG